MDERFPHAGCILRNKDSRSNIDIRKYNTNNAINTNHKTANNCNANKHTRSQPYERIHPPLNSNFNARSCHQRKLGNHKN